GFSFDASLTIRSKLNFFCTSLGCIPGLYGCISFNMVLPINLFHLLFSLNQVLMKRLYLKKYVLPLPVPSLFQPLTSYVCIFLNCLVHQFLAYTLQAHEESHQLTLQLSVENRHQGLPLQKKRYEKYLPVVWRFFL